MQRKHECALVLGVVFGLALIYIFSIGDSIIKDVYVLVLNGSDANNNTKYKEKQD